MRTLPLLLALALLGCPAETASEPVAPLEAPAVTPVSAAGALEPGAWREYPEPADEPWAVAELDEGRWALVSLELACSDRAHQGDPQAQTRSARRVLAWHRTTGEAVMAYGIAVNAEPSRGLRLGERIAGAAERCR